MQFSEALQQLSDIISSFEASYEASEDSSGEVEFAPVLNAAVEPLVEAVKRSSEALSLNAPTRYTLRLASLNSRRKEHFQLSILTVSTWLNTSFANVVDMACQINETIAQSNACIAGLYETARCMQSCRAK